MTQLRRGKILSALGLNKAHTVLFLKRSYTPKDVLLIKGLSILAEVCPSIAQEDNRAALIPTVLAQPKPKHERNPGRIPTKQNMRSAMKWLVQDCQPGDSLFFHYSGHGLRQKDYNLDEIDGFDEAICPIDFETEGPIIDDEINATIVRTLPRGVKLHAVIDTCFSGTVLDLLFMYRIISREGHYQREYQRSPAAVRKKGTSGGIAISFSACDDHQTSASASAFTGKVTGVMTSSFIQAVQNEPGSTYGRLLNAMHYIIPSLVLYDETVKLQCTT
ncbi:hypothetical protein WN943_025238 [Citrus x changshan-huyou]